jgi:hypothetical protein
VAYPTTYVRAASPPSGGPTPGAKALMAGILAHFPATNLGIYNPRDVCGNPWPNFKCSPSQHATGRACDFGIPVASRPTLGDRIAQHLVTHCTALGITEVIWHRRRWTKTGGWVAYSGRSPHLDHVHTTLHPDAAARLSSAEVDATFTPTPTPPPNVLGPIVERHFPEDQMRSLSFTMPLDDQGNGWRDITVDPAKVSGFVVNAADPPVHGYGEGVDVSRLDVGGKTRVVVVNGHPKGAVGLTVWVVD